MKISIQPKYQKIDQIDKEIDKETNTDKRMELWSKRSELKYDDIVTHPQYKFEVGMNRDVVEQTLVEITDEEWYDFTDESVDILTSCMYESTKLYSNTVLDGMEF